MDNLSKYEFKTVRVTATDGAVRTGFVDLYTSAADNDDTEDSIGIIPTRTSKSGTELYASEIQSIEILD